MTDSHEKEGQEMKKLGDGYYKIPINRGNLRKAYESIRPEHLSHKDIADSHKKEGQEMKELEDGYYKIPINKGNLRKAYESTRPKNLSDGD